jgi:hypothetical protein
MDKILCEKGDTVTVHLLNYGDESTVMKIHETNMSISIYVGDKNLIDAKLLKTVNGDLYEVGYLSKICVCEDSLIKVLLSYIHSNYPVDALRFSDMTWVYGDIHLAAFKYLTVSKRWYEDNFGGVEDEQINLFYKLLDSKLLEKKQKTSWEQLGAYIPVDKLSLPVEEVRELYMNAATWQDFFRPIVETLGEKVYLIFSPWFHGFVTAYLGVSYISLEYILQVKDYGVAYVVR